MLQQKAVAEFARLNGWKPSNIHFGPGDIGTSRRGHSARPHFDHPIYFRDGRTNIAIVGQPYIDLRLPVYHAPTWADLAFRYDVAISFPRNPRASFHFPRHTYFAVLHARGHRVVWLPEQQ